MVGRSIFDVYDGPNVYYCIVSPQRIDLEFPEVAIAVLEEDKETITPPTGLYEVVLERSGEYYVGEARVTATLRVFCAPKRMVEERYKEYRARVKRASKAKVIAALLRDIYWQARGEIARQAGGGRHG